MASRHCCVPHCPSDDRKRTIHKNYKVSFHTFPKEEKLRNAWIAAIHGEAGKLFKIHDRNTVVCSKHFAEDDLQRSFTRRKQLVRHGAVPQVFDWSKGEELPLKKSSLRRNVFKVAEVNTYTKMETTPSYMYVPTEADEENTPLEKLYQDHDYTMKDYAFLTIEERLDAAEKYVDELEAKILGLQSQRFCLERFSSNPDLISFYTGFDNYELLCNAFDALQPTADTTTQLLQLRYNRDCETISCEEWGEESIPLIDQFFLFLVKVKQGSDDMDLAIRSGLSALSISRIVHIWANYLCTFLSSLPIWQLQSEILESAPECFSAVNSTARVILDCVEIKTESVATDPSDLQCQSLTTQTTFKGLIGMTPTGGVSFVSPLFAAPISNRDITIKSQLIQLLDCGDQVMVVKDFHIEGDLADVGATLVHIPAFVNYSTSNLSSEEVEEAEKTLHLITHVEQAFQRVKDYHVFNGIIPANMAEQLWTVCCFLTNFMFPLY